MSASSAKGAFGEIHRTSALWDVAVVRCSAEPSAMLNKRSAAKTALLSRHDVWWISIQSKLQLTVKDLSGHTD